MKKAFLFNIVFLFFSFPTVLFSTSPILNLSVDEKVAVGGQFTVDVLLDAVPDPINTIAATIAYDPTSISFAGYQEGGVLQLWFEPPHEVIPGNVRFSGIIPGGVSRSYNPLQIQKNQLFVARLLFVVNVAGEHSFSITAADIRLHDGNGTPLAVTTAEAVAVSAEQSIPVVVANDIVAPEPFALRYEPPAPLARVPAQLFFSVTDLESGIARYEVKIGHGRWKEVQSPLALTARAFPVTITVRAYDFAGNMQESRIIVPGSATSGAALSLLALILFIIIIVRAMLKKGI